MEVYVNLDNGVYGLFEMGPSGVNVLTIELV